MYFPVGNAIGVRLRAHQRGPQIPTWNIGLLGGILAFTDVTAGSEQSMMGTEVNEAS